MIWAGIKLRAEIEREWLLWLMGGVSVLFGLLLIAQPAAGLLGFVWAIATWAVADRHPEDHAGVQGAQLQARLAPTEASTA